MISIRNVLFINFIFLALSCSESDKSNVEDINEDKFANKTEEKNAQFIVDALDYSYGILEAAQLGEEKTNDILLQGQAKKIIEGQTSVIIKLKTFAERKGITIPFSGPEKTQNRIKKLYNKEGAEFDEAWQKEMGHLNSDISQNSEKFMNNADTALKPIIASSLKTFHQHQELINSDTK